MITPQELLIFIIFMTPIALIAIALTPYSKEWTSYKRSALIDKSYKDKFKK